MAMQLFKSLAQRVATFVPVKPFLLRGTSGVVSFTFDDFPCNALEVGGDILNRYQAAGTYYVAGSLTNREQNGFQCHSIADIKSAVRNGHEIASHGYGHLRYSDLSSAQIDEDLRKNQQFLTDVLGEVSNTSFSYPFGARVLSTKRFLSAKFFCSRGIYPGINGRLCDFSDLRANSIYVSKITEHRIAELIERAAKRAGWLIFYTHDVSDTPSAWGATPAALEFAVRESIATGCRVLPIRSAIGAMSFG
jgi:peptidoglycan/xylan/chitin deacetylase (PgdA/CDA1 family)